MQKRDFLKTLGLAALGGAVGAVATQSNSDVTTAPRESVYERVMRTKTLRCGYIPYSYNFVVDVNSSKKFGVMYDLVNEMGRLLDLKIDWVEELTWATVPTALQAGRVDVMASGMWIDSHYARYVGFSRPIFYNSIGAYVRSDERRFSNIEQLNNPLVRVVSRDGGTSGIIRNQDFPKTTLVSLPSGVSDGEMLSYLTTGKADVIFYGDDYMAQFMKTNPGKVKRLFSGDQLRKFAIAIATPIQDQQIASVINNSLIELSGSNFVDKLLKAQALPGSWIPAIH